MSNNRALAIAAGGLALTLLVTGAARAQPCTGAMQADIERERVKVEAAEDVVKARKAYIGSVTKMDPATLRREFERASRQVAADRAAVAANGGADAQRRLTDSLARKDFLTDAVTRALIDEKPNPARNPYVKQVQEAELAVRKQTESYNRAVQLCGGRPAGPTGPTTTTALPPPPAPLPSNGLGANFGSVTPAEAVSLAPAFIDRTDLPNANIGGWGGEYSDGYIVYTMTATDNALLIIGKTRDGDGTLLHDWDACRVDRAQIRCRTTGYIKWFDDDVRFTGRVVASRNGGTIVARVRFDTIRVVRGTSLGLTPGQVVSLNYRPY